MSRAFIGTTAGMALTFAGSFGGFAAVPLVAALGAIDSAVGAWLDGGGQPHDLRAKFERSRR